MDPGVVLYCEKEFARIGSHARLHGVRLSFHPGQFTVLASSNPGIVDRSIEEFEYHANMARWMGYGRTFQDFKINVHISGRAGPEGIRSAYKRLSTVARSCITIENEENSWGLDDCLDISDIIPIVLDVHHHFINSGEYIQPTDPRIQQVVNSWRGVRPTMHYSQSREDYLDVTAHPTRPQMALLLEQGYRKQKLRAHSDFMWNKDVNEWAYGFWENFDVMVEAKGKNLASFELYEFWKSLEE
jgi:UV DNA damage repair endonuclease